MPEVYQQMAEDREYLIGRYTALNTTGVKVLPDLVQEQFIEIQERETQGALAKMALFPAFMLVSFLGLILYFRTKGGYHPVLLAKKG